MAEAAPDRDAPGTVPPPGDGASGPAGIAETLARLAQTLLSALDTRVQLAALEFAEERERAKRRVVLLLTCAVAAAFALLTAQALIVALAWPTWGWRSLAILTAGWLVLAALTAWRLLAAAQREQRPFAGSLAELERDRRWLAERLRRGPR